MKRLLMALAVVAAFSTTSSAHKFEKNGILIKHPWTRATADGARVGVGYLTITNTGKEADKLIGGAFEGADAVEIHQMKMDGDKMLMRQLKDGLDVQPGQSIGFSPGGYHLMFVGLKKPIAQGANIKGSLTFEKAGAIDESYKVEALGATSSSDGDHGGMKMDDPAAMHDHPQ
jgi:periplasmic copper chaperone A